MNKTLLAAALCTALTGCSMVQEYLRPNAPIPANWPESAKTGGSLRQSSWQNYFSDPRLQALISAALENNRDLRIATARIAEARAQYGLQNADKLPNLSLTAAGNDSLTPAGASATGTKMSVQRYDAGLTLVAYELDFWGRVESLNRFAKASYLSTEAAQRAFRLSLIADVANAYLSLLELQERAQLATDTARTRGVSRDLIQRRRELGASNNLDFLQADGAYQAALAEVANLQRLQAQAENLLTLLVGRTPGELKDLPKGRSLAQQNISSELLAGLPAEVLLQRPDVISAEQRLIAANANIGAARAAFFPRISLTGSIGTASRTLSGLFDSGSGAWSFQPALSLPLFDAGRNQANADIAEARKVVAVADYEKTIQQAFREVADLLNARVKIADQLAAQQAYADTQSQRLKLVQARYTAGIINHLEVLDAERDTFAAQQNLLQVQRSLLSASTQLYKALAGRELAEPETGK